MSLLENLKAMNRDELVKFADTQGVRVHHKAKPETIIKQIIDAVSHPIPPAQESVDARLMAQKEPVFNTPALLEQAISHITTKYPDFKIVYSEENKVVTFSYKGSEECHNMSVPLSWLKDRARLVSRGRIAPLGRPEFDSLNSAIGRNAYTNTVLAG